MPALAFEINYEHGGMGGIEGEASFGRTQGVSMKGRFRRRRR
jgi:hypothetical protein